jgi:hypothetical protein
LSNTHRDKRRWENKHKQWRDDYETVEYDRLVTRERECKRTPYGTWYEYNWVELPPEKQYTVKDKYSIQKPGLHEKKNRKDRGWNNEWNTPSSWIHDYHQVPYRAKEQQWERNAVKAWASASRVTDWGHYTNVKAADILLTPNEIKEIELELAPAIKLLWDMDWDDQYRRPHTYYW